MTTYNDPLFRKLRPKAFTSRSVKPENALQTMLDVVAERAKAHPIPYGHWYVDGGAEAKYDPALTCVSYRALEPARAALTTKMRSEIERAGHGPRSVAHADGAHEARRHRIEFRSANGNADPVMARFQLKVLTEASGTQIFATTFAQWTAREALRRAQPVTLAGPIRTAAKTETDERNDFRSRRIRPNSIPSARSSTPTSAPTTTI